MADTAADTRTAEVREILDSYFRLTGSLLDRDIPYLAADLVQCRAAERGKGTR